MSIIILLFLSGVLTSSHLDGEDPHAGYSGYATIWHRRCKCNSVRRRLRVKKEGPHNNPDPILIFTGRHFTGPSDHLRTRHDREHYYRG